MLKVAGKNDKAIRMQDRATAGWRLGIMALEQRFMFDAAGIATVAETVNDPSLPQSESHGDTAGDARAADGQSPAEPAAATVQGPHVAPEGSPPVPQTVVFVDPSVNDYQTLVKDSASDATIVLLDPDREAFGQMAGALAGMSNLDSVQVVSHGGEGHLYIAGRVYWTSGLANRAADFQAIGSALRPGGDILFYACNVGAGQAGQDFVETIHRLTGADVAASSDSTGNGEGKNWTLEVQTGSIEASSPFATASMKAFSGTMADRVVTVATGTSGTSASDGSLNYQITNATDGEIIVFAESLRNAPVSLGVTTSLLSVSGKSLTINGDVNGDGIADITVSGDGDNNNSTTTSDYRGITYNASGKTLTVKNLVFERFYTESALQGVLTVQNGSLVVDGVTFKNNVNNVIATTTTATSLTIRNSIFRDNVGVVTGTAAYAPIRSQVTGTLTVENSVIVDNTYTMNAGSSSTTYRGGVILQQRTSGAFTVNIRNVTIANNVVVNNDAGASGFSTATIGVHSGASGSVLNVTNTIIAGNSGSNGGTAFPDGNAISYHTTNVTLNAHSNYQGAISGTATFNDSTNANHDLRDYRPAATATSFINQGDSTNASDYGGSYDIRGIDRIRDGALDIGAYEVHWNNGTPDVDLGGTGKNAAVSSSNPGSGVVIASSATLSQTDTDTRLLGATITLSGIADTGSETLTLSPADVETAKGYGIGVLANNGATITLSGAADLAHYQAVIRLIQYKNSAVSYTAGARTATITVHDGETTSTARTSTVTLVAAVDTTPPTIDGASSTPAHNATGVAVGADIVVDFSENVAFGASGTITLYNVTTGQTVESWNVANAGSIGGGDGQISISGDKLTINPTGTLRAGTQYAVRFSAGSIVDTAGTPNQLAAVTDNSHSFTTAAPTVTLGIDNATIAENGGTATVTATLSAAASTDVTVTLTPSGTAAGGGTDYTLSSTTITIAAGSTTGTATITAVNDTADENDETVILDITGVSGGGGASESGTQQVTTTIADDDAAPTLSIADVSQAEGDSGTTTMTFTVTLSAASGKTVTVDYATADGTAAAGSDYTSTSGTLTFTAGETSKTFTVTIAGDTVTESDETFTVTLSNPANATLGTATATGTIQNDEGPTVTSVVRQTPSAASTNADSVTWRVTFSEAVSNVSADGSDFAVAELTGATIAVAPVSGTVYDVTVSGGTIAAFNGTITLALAGGHDIRNGSAVAVISFTPTGTDQRTYTIDNTAPTTTIATAAFSADTGPSPSDFVTNTAVQTISGMLSDNLAADETVSVSLDDGATWVAATATAGQNTWSLAGQTLTGSGTLKVKVTDAAGNDGPVFSQAYVYDATAPALTITDTTAHAYTENGAASAITGTVTLTEPASPGGSVLTVQITANAEAADTLSLPTGTASGINIDGSNTLRSGTTAIGTVTAASVTSDTAWTITFLASATAADIQAVVEAVRYHNTSDTPGTSNRTVGFTLTDGAGNAMGTAATRTVAVTAVNDAPTDIALSSATVSTFDAGTNVTVGSLTRTDVDGGGPTYSIVSVNGQASGAVYGLFAISGTTLQAANPSATAPGDYTVVIRVNDGTSDYDKPFTVTVSNILIVTTNLDSGADATTGGTYASELADGGGLSLREAVAIAIANGGGTIGFAAGLSGQTISLGSGLSLSENIAFDLDTAGTLTLSGGTITVAAGKTLTVSNGTGDSATLAAAITGAGSLTKTGAGTLTLTGSNDYAGGTTVSGGTLSIAGDGNLGSDAATVTLDGGTLDITGSGVTLDDALVIGASGGTVGNANGVTLSGGMSGPGVLTKAGAGTLTLSGTNSHASTTVTDGTLSVTGSGNLGSGPVTLNGGGLTVTGTGNVTNAIALASAATITNGNAVTLSGTLSGTGGIIKAGAGTLTLSGTNTHTGAWSVTAGGLTAGGGSAIGDAAAVDLAAGTTLTLSAAEAIGALSGAGTVTLGAHTLTVSQTADTTFSGVIGGTGGLTKQGSGTLTLSGNNTHTGATTIGAGGLTLDRSGGALADTTAVTVGAGATLTLNHSDTVGSIAGAGAIALGANTLTAGGDNSSTTMSGVISGTTGALVKTGTGTLTLSGANTYTGSTTVRGGGTLSVAGAGNLGTGALIIDAAALDVTGAATLANAVTLTGTAVLSNGAAVTLSGVLSGSGGLTKSGMGTLTLSNTTTYQGATTVAAGTLSVTGALGATSGVTVAAGATLGGTGSVFAANAANTLTVTAGGTLAPGAAGLNGGVGILTVNGNLVLNGTLALDIAGTAAGTGYDQVVAVGAVTLTGSSFAVNYTLTGSSNNTFTVIDNDGADTVTGTVTGVAEGTLLTSNARQFLTSYAGGSGNDVTLKDNTPPVITSTPVTAVNEDAAYRYTVAAADTDGDTVTLTATTLPSWLTFDGRTLSGTPTKDHVGTHAVVLSASDGKGGTVTQGFSITVAFVNDAPVITSVPSTAVNEDTAYSYRPVATDEEGQAVTFDAVTLPPWLTFRGGVLSGTPGTADVGTHTVVLRATDAAGATVAQSFTVTVNGAPVFSGLAPLAATAGETFATTIRTSDPDGGGPVRVTAAGLPAWARLTDNGDGTASLTGTPGAGDSGTVTLVLTVTDAAGAYRSQSVTLTVTAATALNLTQLTLPTISTIAPTATSTTAGGGPSVAQAPALGTTTAPTLPGGMGTDGGGPTGSSTSSDAGRTVTLSSTGGGSTSSDAGRAVTLSSTGGGSSSTDVGRMVTLSSVGGLSSGSGSSGGSLAGGGLGAGTGRAAGLAGLSGGSLGSLGGGAGPGGLGAGTGGTPGVASTGPAAGNGASAAPGGQRPGQPGLRGQFQGQPQGQSQPPQPAGPDRSPAAPPADRGPAPPQGQPSQPAAPDTPAPDGAPPPADGGPEAGGDTRAEAPPPGSAPGFSQQLAQAARAVAGRPAVDPATLALLAAYALPGSRAA